jgi:hypothetical protein
VRQAWHELRLRACLDRRVTVIPADFEKSFICAETIAYEDYVTLSGVAGGREAGKFRLAGKEYVVADGDVLHFRFNT